MKLYSVLFGFVLLLLCCSRPVSGAEIGDFRSDGCSLFPDGTVTDGSLWCECCFIHDIAYWSGGSRDDRRKADQALHDCVLERTGDRTLAQVMYDGVRAGGHPVYPTWYRWGYGWKYGRAYAPLTGRELEQAARKLEQYYKIRPGGYCSRE